MQTVREVTPREMQFMVHPVPVRGKRYRGERVYTSCNHIGRGGSIQQHPDAFMFIVVEEHNRARR